MNRKKIRSHREMGNTCVPAGPLALMASRKQVSSGRCGRHGKAVLKRLGGVGVHWGRDVDARSSHPSS